MGAADQGGCRADPSPEGHLPGLSRVFLGVYPFELIVMPADELVEGCFSGPSRTIDTFHALHHEEQVEQRGCREEKNATHQEFKINELCYLGATRYRLWPVGLHGLGDLVF